MTTIDYEKYANMSQRQLFNSLLNARKKEQKIIMESQKKIKQSKELVKFLEAKIKESLDKPKYEFVPLEETQSFKDYIKRQEQMSEAEKAKLDAEVEADINKDYGDEL